MKFKKNRVYEALYLSDIHYLIDSHKIKHSHGELFLTLDYFQRRNIHFRKIFLVGDIIENWYFNAARKIRQRKKKIINLFDTLEGLTTNQGQKVYIIGNHDTTRYDQDLPPRIKQLLHKKGWRITEVYRDNAVVVAHGHQGQYGQPRWFFNILLLRMLYKIPLLWQLLEGIYNKYLDFDKLAPPAKRKKFYLNLIKKLEPEGRLLIVGHTHRFTSLENLKVANTGDWIASRSFLVQHKQKIHGFRFLAKPKKKQFTFRLEYTLNLNNNNQSKKMQKEKQP